jgi:cytochrome c553
MTPSRSRSIAALLLAACGCVHAQTAAAPTDGPATLRTRSLAAQCAQCHGTEGRALPGAEMPGLAGMPASSFVEQMKAFRAGSRPSSVMQQLAKGFNDAQVDQLARYFAAQPAGSKP